MAHLQDAKQLNPSETPQQSTYLHGVSPDRTDNPKVTMQTRIAVRDKNPHRFQVVPLKEVGKGLPEEHAQSPNPFGIKLSQARTSKFTVHIDETSPKSKKPVAQNSKREPGKPVLQSKDLNRNTQNTKHRKAGSLEVDSPHEADDQRGLSSTKPFTPSHGYSHSMNQYSFTLRPWKGIGNGPGESNTNAARQTATSNTLNRSLPPNPNDPERSSKGDSHSKSQRVLGPVTPGSEDLIPATALSQEPSQNTSKLERAIPDEGFAVKESPGGLRFAHSGPFSYRTVANDTRKRHAIYACSGFDPLVRDSTSYLTQSQLALETNTHEIVDLKEDARVGLMLSSGDLSSDGLVESFYPVRPLNLVRNSLVVPIGLDLGELVYPTIVLQLMNELDDAIDSWNSSDGCSPS